MPIGCRIRTTGCFTVTVRVARSFPALVSSIVEVTDAARTPVPAATNRMGAVSVRRPPGASEPMEHALPVKQGGVPTTVTMVSGREIVTWTSVASPGALLDTSTLRVPVPPTKPGSGSIRTVTATSVVGGTRVTSTAAVAALFAATESGTCEPTSARTECVPTTIPVTGTLTTGASPGARVPRSHETSCGADGVQGAGSDATDSPVGMVSSSTTCGVRAGPRFLTVAVNVDLVPIRTTAGSAAKVTSRSAKGCQAGSVSGPRSWATTASPVPSGAIR